ncbi:MAG TPA: hypothetical protein PK939_07245, partial [Bacteroidales bacterium]|nr:hypothetical protein [Bacteroidales bacterium]
MKVLKFGGTSVGNAAAIQSLVEIVKAASENDKELVVVCSAMGGVTNHLIHLANEAAAGNDIHDGLWELREKHLLTMEAFFCENKTASNVLEPHFAVLQQLLGGIATLRECSPRTMDRVMALGEQLSCTLVAAVFSERGFDSIYTDARQLIATDSSFGNAKVNEAVTNERIRRWAGGLSGKLAVVTGFIAADSKG